MSVEGPGVRQGPSLPGSSCSLACRKGPHEFSSCRERVTVAPPVCSGTLWSMRAEGKVAGSHKAGGQRDER